MTTAENIARELDGRRSGAGWVCRCPAHEDRSPSLSVTEKDGRLLVKCFAGCGQQSVVDALKARGLWQPGESGRWADWRNGIRYMTEWGTPVREYRYTSETGEHLYSVVRFEPKSFRPGYFDGERWQWKKHPRQVLYRLPEVLEAPIVFVTEGERDVETLREWGFVATTNAGGAKAPWLPEFSEALRGREVIIVPDNDRPGWERARVIAGALLGQAARIVVLDDIHRDGAKDITEWFAAGHSECELISVLEGCHAV